MLGAGLAAGMLLLAGCGGAGASSASATTGTGSAATSGGSKPLPKVSIAVPVNVLSFAPLWMAQQEKLFQKNGVNAQLVMMQGGGPALQALVANSVPFTVTDSGAPLETRVKGIDTVVSVETMMDRLTLDLVMSNKIVQQDHITAQTPYLQKLKDLKGLRIGITSPGAASDTYVEYFMHLAGLNAKKDAKLISIGGNAELVSSMKAGQIDAFMISPPAGQQTEAQGAGQIVLSAAAGQIPSLPTFPYEILATTTTYAAQHPAIVKDVATALAEGGDLMYSNPAKALSDLEAHFSTVSPAQMKLAVKEITPAVAKNGLATQAGWAALEKIDAFAGILKSPTQFPATEGTLWTNKYLPGGS